MGQIYLNGEAYGGGGGGGSTMYRVNYYNYNGDFISREYVRDGDDAIYSYKTNKWSDTEGGAEVPNIQEDVEEDLDLYYVYGGAIVKYSKVCDYTGTPYSHTYTVEKAGNYFVYVNAGSNGGSSALSCSGTQKYYNTFAADGNRKTKVGIYACDVGDTITMEFDAGNAYREYASFTALVIDMNTTFDSVTLEQSQTTTETGTCDKSTTVAGKKFAFANINYDKAQENHNVYCTCTDENVEIETLDIDDVKSSTSAFAAGTMSAGNTLKAYAKQSTSYGTSIVLIFNLVTSS